MKLGRKGLVDLNNSSQLLVFLGDKPINEFEINKGNVRVGAQKGPVFLLRDEVLVFSSEEAVMVASLLEKVNPEDEYSVETPKKLTTVYGIEYADSWIVNGVETPLLVAVRSINHLKSIEKAKFMKILVKAMED